MVSIKPEQFRRIWSALITPMNADESINYTALERIVELQIQDGVEGFYCCGSSGEGLLLTLEERKQVLEHVLKAAAGRVPVISHVGTIRTKDVIDLAAHAISAGALAVSMIPPYYYKFSMDEIIGYYEDVIRALPDVPAIIYNIPQFTGVEFNKDNAGRLLANENIVGIKHTSTNLYSLERMGQAFPGKALINGFDEQFLGALSMGSCATIGTTVNLFPTLFHQVRDAFDRGDMATAYRWQHAINLRVEETVHIGIFNAMKYGWTLRGVDCGFCRAPFRPLSVEARQTMKKLLECPLEITS
jgi:N-acetylneuraminate lyase